MKRTLIIVVGIIVGLVVMFFVAAGNTAGIVTIPIAIGNE